MLPSCSGSRCRPSPLAVMLTEPMTAVGQIGRPGAAGAQLDQIPENELEPRMETRVMYDGIVIRSKRAEGPVTTTTEDEKP